MKPWHLYIIQSQTTGKLYTGISTDVDRRVAMHNKGKGAKFTRIGGPWLLVYVEKDIGTMGDALRREREVKKLTRPQKLAMINRQGP